MIDLLQTHLNQRAENTLLLSEIGRSFNVGEVKQLCRSLCAELQAEGIDSIALLANNSVDWVVVDLACQSLGITLLPLPTYFAPAQIAHALSVCQITAVMADKSVQLENYGLTVKTQVELESSKLNLYLLDGSSAQDSFPQGTQKITFTSGSTGQPRGVCLSQQQLLQQAQVLAEVVAIPKPRHLCLLPLSTLLENVAGVYAPIIAGGEVIVPGLEQVGFTGSSALDHKKFLTLIASVEPDSIILTPQLLQLLVMATQLKQWQVPSSLKFVAVGGARVPKVLLEQAQQAHIPVFEGYGLSECASVVSLNRPEQNRFGSCGKALPHVQVKIEMGEIVVSGNTMLGYVGNRDSWNQRSIYTGDLGFIDDAGFIHINGRKKNVLISSYGRNISPEWLECELLASSLIAEIIVFGDAKPYCIALITPAENVSEEQVQSHLDKFNQQAPDYAQIKAWHRLVQPIASLPGLLTSNGKPKRTEIAQKFSKQIENLYSNEITEV